MTSGSEPNPAALLAGHSRETTIRRDAEGRWYYDGDPLDHPNLTRAFDRWIGRADDGRYCLKNDINWAYFTLEGAPYFVRGVRAADGGAPELLLSNDAVAPLALASLRMGPEGALYCDVEVAPELASGPMPARFERHAASQLEPWLGEDQAGVYVEAQGQRARPKTVSDPLQPVTS